MMLFLHDELKSYDLVLLFTLCGIISAGTATVVMSSCLFHLSILLKKLPAPTSTLVASTARPPEQFVRSWYASAIVECGFQSLQGWNESSAAARSLLFVHREERLLLLVLLVSRLLGCFRFFWSPGFLAASGSSGVPASRLLPGSSWFSSGVSSFFQGLLGFLLVNVSEETDPGCEFCRVYIGKRSDAVSHLLILLQRNPASSHLFVIP